MKLAPAAEWIDVGKRGFCDSTGQATIDALLVHHAQRHKTVVRLKGAVDPRLLRIAIRAAGQLGGDRRGGD